MSELQFKLQMLEDSHLAITGTLTTEKWNAEQNWTAEARVDALERASSCQLTNDENLRASPAPAQQAEAVAWIAQDSHTHGRCEALRESYWMASLILAQDQRWRRA